MMTRIAGLRIRGIASAVPKNRLHFHDLAEQFGKAYVQRVQQSTGIEAVRVADAGLRASDLCEEAAEQLISDLKIERSTIDGIVFVSQTPDQIMPATSVLLQHRLGLSTACLAFDINYGCSGYVYGLLQGALLIQSGICGRVLVCAGDVITPHLRSSDSHVRMVLGDAGSATLIEKGDGVMSFALHSDGAGASHLNTAPDGYLHMDGAAVMQFALRVVPEVIGEVLGLHGWIIGEVETFALHQANRFMLQYLRKKLAVDARSVPISIADVGNTGPASIPLMLTREGARLAREKRFNNVVICGFGVGLSWGAVALSLVDAYISPMIEIINKRGLYEQRQA